jgi:hypothetical protein
MGPYEFKFDLWFSRDGFWPARLNASVTPDGVAIPFMGGPQDHTTDLAGAALERRRAAAVASVGGFDALRAAATAADAAVEAAQCGYWYDEQHLWRAEFYRALAR